VCTVVTSLTSGKIGVPVTLGLAKHVAPCKGAPIFRGPLRVVRYVEPNGQIGEVVPSASERGATVSVYPDYLVLEGNSGLEGYTRYVTYQEILELELMR